MNDPEKDYLFDPRGAEPGEDDALVVELEKKLAVLRVREDEDRSRTADSGQPTADGGQPTADGGQPTADGGQPTAGGGQPPAGGGRRPVGRWVYIASFSLAAAALAAIGANRWGADLPVARPSLTAPVTTVDEPAGAFAVSVDGKPGRLDRGRWLETGVASRATIQVADIGTVEVAPESRIRLVRTSPAEHRLELAQGKLSAVVVAPPRLFVVDTEAASAVDLGCAYRLEVGKDGEGRLEVDTGAVSLEGHGRTSWVPAGAACETRRGRGPGTPYLRDTEDAVAADLRAFDFGEVAASRAAAERLLARAGARHRLTMWHMVSRVGPDQRGAVVRKLTSVSALPAGITEHDVERLDPAALGRLRDEMQAHW